MKTFSSDMRLPPESPLKREGLWWRRILWLAFLAPLFFISYNYTNNLTAQREVVASLVFDWERHIPLWPWTIVPYWSIDLLYGLSFLLPATRGEIDRHALRLLSAQAICIVGFLLWPLEFTFARPELNGMFGTLFDILMGFDKPYNQAPSLHITLLIVLWACFSAHTRGPLRWLLHAWFALIGLSVLTTWQHHFIDVPSGMLAGFFCLWLLPSDGPSPWRHLHWHANTKRMRLAMRYAIAALLLLALAILLGGMSWWLAWPALSSAMVAVNYLLLGPKGFQKQSDGRMSMAAYWLYGPYLVAAWLNSRAWTHRHPQADEICDEVYLGRLPTTATLQGFSSILDLCAELPIRTTSQDYRSLAVLDLTAPEASTCLEAANAIEHLRANTSGPLLVCCALGYSRSATAVAAWLILTRRCKDASEAFARIRQSRPQVVLHDAQEEALEAMQRLKGFSAAGELAR